MRSMRQAGHARIQATAEGMCVMALGLIKGNPPLQMRQGRRQLSQEEQGRPYGPMCLQQLSRVLGAFGQGEKLGP
jgi:hypothetical protein